MGSLFEAVRGAFGGGQDIQFLSSVLAVSAKRQSCRRGRPSASAAATPHSATAHLLSTLTFLFCPSIAAISRNPEGVPLWCVHGV